MHTIIVGSLDGARRRGPALPGRLGRASGLAARLTAQGARADDRPRRAHGGGGDGRRGDRGSAKPAWEKYRWNLAAPRRLEAEKRGLTQFHDRRRTARSASSAIARPDCRRVRRGGTSRPSWSASTSRHAATASQPRWAAWRWPARRRAVREYMDEYVATGANYFVCSFQWGDLSHDAGDALHRAVRYRGDATVR